MEKSIVNNKNITIINQTIKEYFDVNTNKEWITVKDIMPALIAANIFKKDIKRGLPFRKLLRVLDKENKLDKIPSIHAQRSQTAVYWYIVKPGVAFTPNNAVNALTKKDKIKALREQSDEYYLLNLCDSLLKEDSIRKHTFSYLLGDLHKRGKTRTKLTLPAFYEQSNLAIQFTSHPKIKQKQQTLNAMTVSGITRSEQIEKYNKRRRDTLQKKKVNLLEIDYGLFNYDDKSNLNRDDASNLSILKAQLQSFIK